MTLKRLALLSSILVFSQIASAQSSTSPSSEQAKRDPQAVAVVQSAISAMGGTATIALMQSSVATGTSVDQSAQQNTPGSFTWTYAGSEFRNENNATTGSHILISNAGSPQDYENGSYVILPSVAARTNRPFHIPALTLFSEIANPSYSVVYVGTAALNGINVVHIRLRDESDIAGQLFTLQDWYFNSTTGLPSRVQFSFPTSPQPKDSLPETIDFSNFQPVNGILVPFQLSITLGPLDFVVTMNSVAFNTNMNPSLFTPSTGAAQ